MAKIKGWKKKSLDFWVHDSKRRSVEVDWYNGIRKSGWKVVVAAYSSSGVFQKNISTSKLFESMTNARKVAFRYMRSHPKG